MWAFFIWEEEEVKVEEERAHFYICDCGSVAVRTIITEKIRTPCLEW